MMIYFREVGSKKLLKELNLSIVPTAKDQVKISNNTYFVTSIVFDADSVTYTIWLHKFK